MHALSPFIRTMAVDLTKQLVYVMFMPYTPPVIVYGYTLIKTVRTFH